MRDRALGAAKDYDRRNASNAEFNLDKLANPVEDTMPLFTTAAEDKVDGKTKDAARAATISAISYKPNQQEDVKTADKATAYA